MTQFKFLAIVLTLAVMAPLSALAAEKNHHSVNITDPVTIGTTHLKPGTYSLEWQGPGPSVQVNFVRDGKTVATAPATFRTGDSQVVQDDVVMDRQASNESLKEIDIAHGKEALVFSQGGM